VEKTNCSPVTELGGLGLKSVELTVHEARVKMDQSNDIAEAMALLQALQAVHTELHWIHSHTDDEERRQWKANARHQCAWQAKRHTTWLTCTEAHARAAQTSSWRPGAIPGQPRRRGRTAKVQPEGAICDVNT